jgi:ubiquitin-protein ligase
MCAEKRILTELKGLQKDRIPGVEVHPSPDNLFEWNCIVEGPSGSNYSGGEFRLAVFFPHNYPAAGPSIVFETKILHPNISLNGHLCMKLVAEKWHSERSMREVLLGIRRVMERASIKHLNSNLQSLISNLQSPIPNPNSIQTRV